MFQTPFNLRWELWPVDCVRLIIADVSQGFVGVWNNRRALVRSHRGYLFHHIHNPAWVCYD